MKKSKTINELVFNVTKVLGSSLLVIFFNALRAKLVAVYWGPSGVAWLGLINNYLDINRVASFFGQSTLAPINLRKAQHNLRSIVPNLLIQILINYILVAIFLGIFKIHAALTVHFILLCILSIINISISWLILFYQGINDYTRSSTIHILNCTGNLLGVLIGKYFFDFGLKECIVFGIFCGFVTAIPTMISAFRLVHWNNYSTYLKNINRRQLLVTYSSGFYIACSAVITVGVVFLLRNIINSFGGASLLGIFTVAWIMGISYGGLLFGAVSSVIMPRLAELLSHLNMQLHVFTSLCLILANLTFYVLIEYAGEYLIRILYTSEFYAALQLVKGLILGNIAKSICFPLSTELLVSEKYRQFLISEIIFNLILVIAVYIFITELSLNAVVLSLLLAYLFCYLYLILVNKDVLNRYILLIGLFILIALVMLSLNVFT